MRTRGGASALLLATGVELEIGGATASGRIVLADGERAPFTVHHGVSRSSFNPIDPAGVLDDTIAGWRSWVAEHEGYQGVYREAVNRSALVLLTLTYQPSGAIVAAPTTSLPEILGGEANWDYRFAWLRDASLTLRALWVAACPDEGQRYFDWMAAAVGPPRDRHVQIMFGVEGERDLTEHELDHLAGYAGSRPVRVGNDAWRQRQLDVMGEILEAAYILRDQLDQNDPVTTRFLCDLAERAADGWRDTDAGIWEGREGERHYTSSKLMCWVALDRGVKLAPQLGPAARAEAWATARDEVRAAILQQAFHEERGLYAGAFGSDRLDASVLLMPIMGFMPATEPRMRATIDAIDRELGHDGLVQRWSGADKDEGAFVICSFWLANCLARAGELTRAREVFEHVLEHANDVGLLAEEIDPRSGALLGNFPQAFSHVGLVNAAWSIDEATRRTTQIAHEPSSPSRSSRPRPARPPNVTAGRGGSHPCRGDEQLAGAERHVGPPIAVDERADAGVYGV